MSLRSAALTALVLVSSFPAARAQFSLGPRLGLNLARLHASTSLDERHRLLPGVQVGVAAQIRMGRWALQPAFVFSQKGSRNRYTVTNDFAQPAVTYREKTTIRVPYLELPLNLAYTPRWAHGVQAFAGPYVAIGIGGYSESDPDPVTINGYTLERYRAPLTYPTLFGGRGSVRWHDLGLNVGLGYQHQRLLVQLQQSFGATNALPARNADQEDAGRRHRVTSFTLTYLFGPKPQPDFMLDHAR